MTLDSWESNLYGLPYPIYFYWYSRKELGADADRDSQVIGNCPSLLSVQFVPFLEKRDFVITEHQYDSQRFGKVNPDRPALSVNPWVHRIQSIADHGRVKELSGFRVYKDLGKKTGPGETRYWRNESRLFNYPYSFALLTDNLNAPMTVKYHNCKLTEGVTYVKVRNTLSDRCSYGIFIEGYKGDNTGSMEAMVSGDSHELPCSSSAYSQWYASSKASTSASVHAQVQQAFLQQAQSNAMTGMMNQQSLTNQKLGGFGAITGGLLGGGLMGLGSGMINAGMGAIQGNQQRQVNNLNNQFVGQSTGLSKQSAINQTLAKVSDLQSTPNTMISMGSDVIYGFNKGGSQLSLYRYGVSTEYAVKLADYWAMYGYKQNKILKLSDHINTRYFYNYIKTVGANILGDGSIPLEHLEVMRNIFDKGVTVWHIENKGVNVLDYSMDNYEV